MSGMPYIDDIDRDTMRDLALRLGKVIELETRSGVHHTGVVICVSERAFFIVTDNGGVCLIPKELVWWDDANIIAEVSK